MDEEKSPASVQSNKDSKNERNKRYVHAARDWQKSATILPKTIVAGMIVSLRLEELQS